MAKLRTVNIIQIFGGVINSIDSFTDDDEGKNEAEKLFGDLVHANMIQTVETDDPIIAETISNCLDNGYYSDGDDYYNIIISWSDV